MASSARIDELRRKFDENPRRYFAPLANEYRKAGDAEQAIFICQEYLPQQPGHMSGHIVYGQALFDLGRYDDARAVFETALSLDPENLIALRHLGDIARSMGDTNTARTWYQRVLEADPRNEEIAQLMLSLLASDSPSATATATPTPLNSATVTPPARFATPMMASPTVDQASSAESARTDSARGNAPAELSSAGAASAAPDELRKISPHAPNEADLLDLDDFDLGGVPLSELRAASPTPAYQPAQPFDETTASGIELPPIIGSADTPAQTESIAQEPAPPAEAPSEMDFLTISVESPRNESFQPDPFAIASSSSSIEFEKEEDAPIRSSNVSPSSPAGFEPSVADRVADQAIEPVETPPATAPATPAATPAAMSQKSSIESSLDASEDSDFEPGFASWSMPLARSADAAETPREPQGESQGESQGELHGEPHGESPNEPWVELGTDLHLGLSDDGTAQETVGDAPPTMDGLETFETGVFVVPPIESGIAELEGLQTEPFLEHEESNDIGEHRDGGSVDAHASAPGDARHELQGGDPNQGDQPDDTEPVERESHAEAEAFVTETMAELYLDQGHLESALAIYRKLVEQRPEDPTLMVRMQAIERRIYGMPADAMDSAALDFATEAPGAQDQAAGPTIREFLSALIRRSPVLDSDAASGVASTFEVDETLSDAYAGAEGYGLDDGYADIDEPLGDASAHHPSAHYPMHVPSPGEYAASDVAGRADRWGEGPIDASAAPSPDDHSPSLADSRFAASASETVSGSLGALFSGADTAASDAAAANTLAQAFASVGPDNAALEGMPAHRAKDELSLDHVFKGNSPARAASDGDGFSFDQFFAEEVVEGSVETHVDPGASAGEGADDIAQFNAWLNGLKKT